MVASSIASEATRDVKQRYRDAYLVSKVTIGFGNWVKRIGFLLAGVIFFGALIMSLEANNAEEILVVGGFVVAGLIGLLFYLIGVLVAAHGQVLQATLDTAVNSSPFLTDADRVEIMSLSPVSRAESNLVVGQNEWTC